MNYRTLGKTGLQVSEIGYGAWGIGKGMWVGAEDDESIKALNKAIDLGLNFIDTALVYGDGHSENLVGQVVRGRSERIYVASKIPPKNYQWPAQRGVPVREAFPADHVIASTEESLRNLGLETIDVQQFHVWSDEWADQGDWLGAIQKLKKEGKIRFFGISINDCQPDNAIRLIETGAVDTVQVIHNIFEQARRIASILPVKNIRLASSSGYRSTKAASLGKSRLILSSTRLTFVAGTLAAIANNRCTIGSKRSFPILVLVWIRCRKQPCAIS
jgi:aryl-alcohol dehydrogenase-like predicted oxidoreductase